MQPKSYEILIDIKHGFMNNQIIEVVTGDYGMNNFKFKLLKDRLIPYDLTNTIVRIMAVTPSGSEQQQDCIVENPTGGTLDLTLKQSLFIEPGAHIAELQVYDKDTEVLRVTFPWFKYYVRKSLQDDETVQASDEYSILQQMISDVGDINNNINSRIETHNTNEESHLDIRNIIGELASLTTDEKANLVAAINEVKAQSNENATHILENVNQKSVHGLKIEEGSFSPVLVGATVAGNNTYATQFGRYYKIGNRVFCDIRLTLTYKDNDMSGVAYISGLPFAPRSNVQFTGSLSLITRITYPSDMAVLNPNLSGPQGVRLISANKAGGFVILTNENFADTSDLIFSINYLT